jgi:hypothetical protein
MGRGAGTVPEEPESRRPDIPELIRRADESAAKADAARERLAKAQGTGAAIEAKKERAKANRLGGEQTS